jgi:hypothetical protein
MADNTSGGKPESLRQTIARAVDEHTRLEPAALESTEPPKNKLSTLWEAVDKAVLGLCELLALMFGLPFGDDLYQAKAVTGQHGFYLLVGIILAAAGPIFPLIREYLPNDFSASVANAARDARLWIEVDPGFGTMG